MVRRYAIAITLSISAAVGMFPGVSLRAGPRPQADGSRVALSGMGESRTLLPEGRWLLLGGEGPTGPVWAGSVIDPSTGSTIELPARLNEARAWHTATTLADGTILIVGGRGSAGETLASVERFDPATDTSTSVSITNVTPRAGHTATLLTDGRVLVAGGSGANGDPLTEVEIWDVDHGAAAVLPGGLPQPRTGHRARSSPRFVGAAGRGYRLERGSDDVRVRSAIPRAAARAPAA